MQIKLISFLLLVFLLSGCNKSEKHEQETLNISVIRFEQALFSVDFDTLDSHIAWLNQQYPDFFSLYSNQVIKTGPVNAPAFSSYLQDFLTDYTIYQTYSKTKEIFQDFSDIEEQINVNLWNYQHLLPGIQIPAVYTCISGFNQSIILGDSILAIALDKYLGRDCQFYRKLNWNRYQIKNLYQEKIPSDCIYALSLADFPKPPHTERLIDHMLYYGKALYLTQQCAPETHDTIILGYTGQELAFCHQFEERMWTFLVEQKLLFHSDGIKIAQFTEDGPFTKFFGNNSPPRAANWIGLQVVKQYMKKNPEVSTEALMNNTDYEEILRHSGYNP